ncbi:MAG: CxxC-x17-CxxC domain-containing protein, partial [Thermomicrobiales bacterium]
PDGSPVVPVSSPAPTREQAPRQQTNERRISPVDQVRTTVECTACGQPAHINFSPDTSRPVYCSDCYETMRPNRGRSRETVARV